MNPPGCRLDGAEGARTLVLSGDWRLGALVALDAALTDLRLGDPGRRPARLDGRAIAGLDTAGALLLLRQLAAAGCTPDALACEGFSARHRRILDLVAARLDALAPAPAPVGRGPIARVGAAAGALAALLLGHLAFFGLVVLEIGRVAARPSRLRLRELLAQYRHVCVTAIPVVSLVTFLIGTIVAYLLGQQATQYGANIFVVDGVALGMVREFSPLIVATIVAGRSGAAFTAQLGTMRLTEEIDALRTLGLSPEQVLVIPRVLALATALPLLVFVGNLAGFGGAMIVCDLMLGIHPSAFLERVDASLDLRHYVIGLAKAPAFALVVAIIGCRMGIEASRDTRSIGVNTTSTVVQSIVAVILLDALFAVLLQELDL